MPQWFAFWTPLRLGARLMILINNCPASGAGLGDILGLRWGQRFGAHTGRIQIVPFLRVAWNLQNTVPVNLFGWRSSQPCMK
jgi:hypothetical protein